MKYLKGSKYKYVTIYKTKEGLKYKGTFFAKDGKGNSKIKDTEREAALYVDQKLIENGKQPVNILKKL